MKNGAMVTRFERSFADYVGAEYAVAMCNGTATLQTAYGILDPPDLLTTPLTMSSTSLAWSQWTGTTPSWHDVDAETWLLTTYPADVTVCGVSIFGLHREGTHWDVDDAAQTLRRHDPTVQFTSYSFQASKILATGEGGMLVTDDPRLASEARSYASLGYPMGDGAVIDPEVLKSPLYLRHRRAGWNFRMADAVAAVGLDNLRFAEALKETRRLSAAYYEETVAGFPVATQVVPEGYTHHYWAYPIVVPHRVDWGRLAQAIVEHGGERPYAAWAPAYREPVFQGLLEAEHSPTPECPTAEYLQSRLMLFQTNDLSAAQRNATALGRALAAAL